MFHDPLLRTRVDNDNDGRRRDGGGGDFDDLSGGICAAVCGSSMAIRWPTAEFCFLFLIESSITGMDDSS